MILFPAIDIYDKKAVRLFKGNYDNMTVYSERPADVAKDFEKCGATHAHIVDLEGAKSGEPSNIDAVRDIVSATHLFTEIGGGIRRMDTVKTYFSVGVDRVILGTAALLDRRFLQKAVDAYGDKIAVGADVRDGYIAVKGWLDTSQTALYDFLDDMCRMGVQNVICTDISKDGAMGGTNLSLYASLAEKYPLHITASGGVSTLDDVKKLRDMRLYGAIIGKAYYTGDIRLRDAIEAAK